MSRRNYLEISLIVMLALLPSPMNGNHNSIESSKNFDIIAWDDFGDLPIIDILEFTIDSILKIYDAVQAEKTRKEVIIQLSNVEEQLGSIQDELKNIIQLLETVGVAICYYPDETKIRKTKSSLETYLNYPTDENTKNFIRESSDLNYYIQHLLAGLLGNTDVLCPFGDILANVRNATGCGMRLKTKINAIMGLVMAGLWVEAEYEKINNIPEPVTSSFKESFINSSSLLLKRLDDELSNCQTDESNVDVEMRRVIDEHFTKGRKTVADLLLQFLEDKYETEKWIVVVLPNSGTVNNVYSAVSGGFHTVSTKDMFAAAISIDRRLTQDSVILQDFQFPVETVSNAFQFPVGLGYSLRPKERARDVHEYLSLYLKPLESRMVLESLVIETPCKSSAEELTKFVAFVASADANYAHLTNNGSCVNHIVLVVPVRRILPINSSISEIDSTTQLFDIDLQCNISQIESEVDTNNLLRSQFGQAYLTVQDDSSREATSIVLEREWRNSTGQRWRFVNNQLKNDLGKCLTAWKEQSWYLYQYNCHSDWPGQTWYRRGFQITNGFNLCLAYEGKKEGRLMYAIQDLCDTTEPFLWYNWNTTCEDEMIISAPVEGSRPLRNEFSREYLSVYEDEDYVFHRPWSNHPGQKWKFIDGKLTNDYGKCLGSKGWYIYQMDCTDEAVGSKLWTYNANEKRHIVSADGYCLSVGDQKGYVLNNYCKDDPEYRWWY